MLRVDQAIEYTGFEDRIEERGQAVALVWRDAKWMMEVETIDYGINTWRKSVWGPVEL